MHKDKWVRHTVAVPGYTRVIDSWLTTSEGPKRIEREEMVHMHDVYREKGAAGKVSPQLWHRGAKVGVA
jgi:hypothetical protein